MKLRYTVRQLFRTPLHTLLFTFLIALCVTVFSLGLSLFVKSTMELAHVDDTFVTRGTLTQLPDDTVVHVFSVTLWGETYEYVYDEDVYDRFLKEEDFAALPYDIPLEHRPSIYSHLYREDGSLMGLAENRRSGTSYGAVIIFEPLEDFYSNEYGEILITEGLLGNIYSNVTTPDINGFLYAMNTELKPYDDEAVEADMEDDGGEDRGVFLETGKTYISYAYLFSEIFADIYWTSPQYTTDWNAEVAVSGHMEYTEDFFETDEGRVFDALIQNMEQFTTPSFIVTPTNSLDLIQPFYEDEILTVQGREITAEEFETGAKVCMISTTTANAHVLQVGDHIDISMYATVYVNSLVSTSTELIPYDVATEEPLDEFERGTYEIVSIYQKSDVDTESQRMGVGTEVVFVPMNSIENMNENLIVGGLLSAEMSTFTVQNDRLDEFQAAVAALDLPSAEFTYYDMGYGTVSKGLNNVRLVSGALFAAGGVSVLSLLILFLYLQISRKSQESAIQISLGTGRARTARSLFAGVMLVVLAGTVIGACAGYAASRQVSGEAYDSAIENSYSREYSEDRVFGGEDAYVYDSEGEMTYVLLSGLLVLAVSSGLCAVFIRSSLRLEPIKLLSKGGGEL